MDNNQNLSEFAKLIAEGKRAKQLEEENKKQSFFEKYNIENTEISPFSFISELAKLKQESEQPQQETVVESVEPPTPPKSASELLSELASLIAEGKKVNSEAFEAEKENLETFVAEVVQDIVELKEEEKIAEVSKLIADETLQATEPVEVKTEDDLIAKTVKSISIQAENTNLFSTTEPDKTSPNFKAIQAKLKYLEQWVSRISTAGPGSGSYWLNDLGDTDKLSIQNATDGQVLTFSESVGKWIAADATSNGGNVIVNSIDQYARNTANTASNNITIIQGVDNTQNIRLNSVETINTNQNNSIVIIQGVDLWQNNQITYVNQFAQSAYNYANSITSSSIDQFARDTANLASSNTIYTQGVDLTQNTNITNADSKAQAAFDKANTGTSQLVNGASTVSLSIDGNLTVPGPISGLGVSKLDFTTYGANSAYLTTTNDDSTALFMGAASAELYAYTNVQIRANTAGISQNWTFGADGTLTFPDNTIQTTAPTNIDQFARDTANNASSNTVIIQGVDATQNTRLNALETVNTNQNTSITIIQGVDLTQNTNITNADAKAQAAFNYANTSITTSGGTISGRLNVSYTPASTTGYALQLTAANTVGGTSYADFLRVTNTSGGVTSPNKSFRVNNIGTLEVINSAYTATLMGISDSGQLSLAGAASANNDPTTNFLSFNNNGFAIYDDGNPHIHARANGASMWINTNNGAIILGNQGVFSGAAPASAILIGSSTTVKAYTSIYGSKSYAVSNYGYLAQSGAGQIPGGSGTVPYSLYCDNRIQATEFDATSDERAKDIQGTIPLDQALKFVKDVDGIHYTWNDKAVENDTGLKAGFAAQTIHKAGFDHMLGVIPNDKMEKKVDEDGWVHPEGMQLTMSYNQAIAYHHEVIKHLLQKVEELQNEVTMLKQEKS
jgi:hypothetical protein